MIPRLLLAFDLGTTSLKTCLYEPGGSLTLVASASRRLTLSTGPDGRAEQDPEEWWAAVRATVAEVLAASGSDPGRIAGLTFCAQMQCLVLVDREGRAVRPAVSYLDARPFAGRGRMTAGGPRVEGIGLALLLPWLGIAGGVAASAKDPLWKYHRVRTEEPETFARVHRWLDAKDFLTSRCTGRFTMSTDSAFATFLADTRPSRAPSGAAWHPGLVRRLGVNAAHLPEIVRPEDQVGGLTAAAAADLGLKAGTPVLAGAGDASLIGLGAGASAVGATHVYMGTSGWVSTVTNRRLVDPAAHMATVPGAVAGRYAYFGEQETSGKCLEWVRDHLALDEIGVYLGSGTRPVGPDQEYKSLLDYLTATLDQVPAGSGGVLFAPWLHGSRSPFEDPLARGLFFNLGLETGKRHLIRAVVEGISYHTRLLLEAQARKVEPSAVLRMAGGGALSPANAQILADVTGRPVETVVEPQNAGAAGAALSAAFGLGFYPDLDRAAAAVPVLRRFDPRPETAAVHGRNFAVFRKLHGTLKPLFGELNAGAGR